MNNGATAVLCMLHRYFFIHLSKELNYYGTSSKYRR